MPVHAHEVMQMLIESGKTYTRETFLAALAERFGPEARFHTCSQEGMTADDLLGFLFARGKLSGSAEAEFSMDPANMCRH